MKETSRQSLIIESPSLQTLRQRYAYAVLTLFFWVFWFYLWIPVISLVAWLLGIESFYDQMVVKAGLEALQELLGLYTTVIMALGFSLTGWALYNQIRFRGRERRKGQSPVDTEEVARFFAIEPAMVERLQAAKFVEMTHDEEGHLQAIRSWRDTGQDEEDEGKPG